VEAYPIWDF